MTGDASRLRRHQLDAGDPLPPTDWLPGDPAHVQAAEPDQFARSQMQRLLVFFRRRAALDEASDLAQETLLRWFGATKSQSVERPQAFVSRIAANLAKDRRKALRSKPMLVPLCEADQVYKEDPIAGLEARDTLRRLEAAVASMSAKNREVFLARRLDGDSYAEIAMRTGLSIKGVEWRMSQAIAHIDRFLSDSR